MQSRWSDADARKAVEAYASKGVSEDVALRTYTTRLLGGEPLLVLHGGGNTSVKTQMQDLLGETHEVLCVKGSGWDMGTIEPAGLPAVKLGAAAQAARARRGCPTRTWSTSSASTCSTPARPIRRWRRCCTPSCRTSSSTTRTPPPC